VTTLQHRFGTEVLEATSFSILVTDATLPDNPIIYANAGFSALFGYAISEVIGRNCRFLQGPDSDPSARADIRSAVAAGKGIRREILNYRKDGTSFWNDMTIDPIHDEAGRLTGFVGIHYRADDAHRASEAKAEAVSKLAIVANRIPGYIYQRVMRSDGSIEITYCSPSICRLLEIEEPEVAGAFYEHVHPDDREGLMAAIRVSAAEMSIFQEEFRLVSSTGVVHWVRSDAPPRRRAKGEIVWDGLAIEIGAQKRWQNEIARQALRDPLTGLLTRAAWRQALTMQLATQTVESGQRGLLCIDIKQFRALNDRLGQHAGDEILCETAQRLAVIAESVAGIAARLGGDEFAILVPACADETALSALARAASAAFARPVLASAKHVQIQLYIGAALCQAGAPSLQPAGELASELITQAELALRWAKQESCNAHILYSHERDDRFQNRALLARSLETAIANGELELHYQPLVDLASGRIVSAEALVRWNHPLIGMQRPDLFIPLAETSGLIVPLGRWVLDQSMRQHSQWQAEGLVPPPIAINVSGNQLLDPGFIAAVEESLRQAGAKASDFEIELTEGLLIEPSPQVMASLTALRRLGFTIAIDDFGSGHASFRYLREFPVDKLKIDQIFVRKLVLESTDALIIRAVISLARSMGIRFVAEGIETEMQRDFLEREGCEVGQGALFSMPLVAEDFAWMLGNGIRLPHRV
jgi:diguanylate cyclase (GGDEF)-like protein/PAS domain S-box-containing protein